MKAEQAEGGNTTGALEKRRTQGKLEKFVVLTQEVKDTPKAGKNNVLRIRRG